MEASDKDEPKTRQKSIGLFRLLITHYFPAAAVSGESPNNPMIAAPNCASCKILSLDEPLAFSAMC